MSYTALLLLESASLMAAYVGQGSVLSVWHSGKDCVWWQLSSVTSFFTNLIYLYKTFHLSWACSGLERQFLSKSFFPLLLTGRCFCWLYTCGTWELLMSTSARIKNSHQVACFSLCKPSLRLAAAIAAIRQAGIACLCFLQIYGVLFGRESNRMRRKP